MQLESMSVLRIALLAAVVSLGMPAFAADDTVTVTAKTAFTAAPADTVNKTLAIGANEVRLKLDGGTAYVAVTKGAVDLTYADGSALATVPSGTVLKINGFMLPGSGVVANLTAGKATLSLAAAAALSIQSNSKGSELKLASGSAAPVTLAAGQTATINAPAIVFAAGQSVVLKENQVGTASAGANSFVAIGTATGLAVTTQNATAAIKGAGTDQLILAKGAVLSINDGALYVSTADVRLTGAKLQLVSTAGDIQIMHDGKATAFPTGRTIGGPAPATTATAAKPTTPPPPTPTTAKPTVPPPPAAPVETAAEDQKVLDEMDAWIAGK